MGQRERVANTGMTKKEVQKRVLRNGRPLALSKFEWDNAGREFSSKETGLTVDFSKVDGCKIKTSGFCTIIAGEGCKLNTDSFCAFTTNSHCVFTTGGRCTFLTGIHCTFNACFGSAFVTSEGCTWIVDGKCYPFSPLLIQGSTWAVNVYRPGYLRIGCEDHTFREWSERAEDIALGNLVTPDVLKEYLGLIKVARAWAREKGWLTPKMSLRR